MFFVFVFVVDIDIVFFLLFVKDDFEMVIFVLFFVVLENICRELFLLCKLFIYLDFFIFIFLLLNWMKMVMYL